VFWIWTMAIPLNMILDKYKIKVTYLLFQIELWSEVYRGGTDKDVFNTLAQKSSYSWWNDRRTNKYWTCVKKSEYLDNDTVLRVISCNS